jgi:hypothetical protein
VRVAPSRQPSAYSGGFIPSTCPHLRRSCTERVVQESCTLFVWLVADGWCWFVLREKYCWLVAGGWFVVREKYCWLVADKPSEQAAALIFFRIFRIPLRLGWPHSCPPKRTEHQFWRCGRYRASRHIARHCQKIIQKHRNGIPSAHISGLVTLLLSGKQLICGRYKANNQIHPSKVFLIIQLDHHHVFQAWFCTIQLDHLTGDHPSNLLVIEMKRSQNWTLKHYFFRHQ